MRASPCGFSLIFGLGMLIGKTTGLFHDTFGRHFL